MSGISETIEYADFSLLPESSGIEKRKSSSIQPQVQVRNIKRWEQAVFLGQAVKVRKLLAFCVSSKPFLNLASLEFSVKQIMAAVLLLFALSFTGIGGAVIEANFIQSQSAAKALAFGPKTPPELPEQIARPLGDALFKEFSQILATYHPDMENSVSLEARKHLLYRYLSEWNSPLVENVDTIAEQPHWKLILAISFAESSLGKRCADNNCSGIGVAPGHPKWQKYESRDDWVRALNRLLEKRYKNQTLNQMCGVYVQPCNDNWLSATGRILNELNERQIN